MSSHAVFAYFVNVCKDGRCFDALKRLFHIGVFGDEEEEALLSGGLETEDEAALELLAFAVLILPLDGDRVGAWIGIRIGDLDKVAIADLQLATVALLRLPILTPCQEDWRLVNV